MDTKLHTKVRKTYTGFAYQDRPFPLGKWNSANAFPDISPSNLTPWTVSLNREKSFEEASVDMGGKSSWNDFDHYKIERQFNDSIQEYLLVNTFGTNSNTVNLGGIEPWTLGTKVSGVPLGEWWNPLTGLPLLYAKNADTGYFIVEPSGINSLINSSVRTMLGEIRPDVSLINTLYEFKDVESVYRTIDRIVATGTRLKKLIPGLEGYLPRRLKHAREFLLFLATAADVFLQKSFNIDPLISDFRSTENALRTIRSDILKRMADDSRVRRRDYNAPLPGYVNSDDNAVYNLSNPGPSSYRPTNLGGQMIMLRQVRYHRARFHAQVLYSKYYSDYQKQNALILGLLDRLGVMFNPAIVWNALPWSFVVDWGLSVGRFLDQFKYGNLEPVTVVHKFLWSIDVKRTINLVVQQRVNISPKTYKSNPRSATFITESAYKRSTQRLNVISALSGSGISLKEFILASALKHSRYR